MTFLLLSLLSVALGLICTGTTGVNTTTSCFMTSAAECNHKYQPFADQVKACWRSSNGWCNTSPGACTPICNGTWAASSCSKVSAARCHQYYEVDSVGAHFCYYNPVTAKCAVKLPKLYCEPGYGIPCNAPGGASNHDICPTLTTQAACNSAYAVQTNGLKNKCEWDPLFNSCYTGRPCWTTVPIDHP